MNANAYIEKLVKFANNIEQHTCDATLLSVDIAKKELESSFDKGVNIEGKSFEGGEWWSNDFNKRKKPYTSKRGRSFKSWYPRLKGHYKTLDLTGDFREGISFEKNLFDVEAVSSVSYSQKIIKNLRSQGIDIFSFKKSKKTKQAIFNNLIKIYKK